MTEHKPRISSATLSHRSLDPSQDPNCTDEQLPGAVDPIKKQDVTKQPINTMPDNGKPIQTQAQQDIADVSRQSPNLSLRQQPEGDSEPEIIAAPALSVQPPGAEELADQTEIEMPKESVEPVEDVYENANPQDYGIDYEPEDVDYEPPDEGNKDLPDLNNLLQSLDTDSPQNDQDAPVAPPVETPEAPSLFMVPEHVTNYQKIAGLRMQLEEEEVDPYIDDFDAGARDDLLMIGNISLEEVQEEERRLRDEHIAYREQEAMKEHRKQQMIIQQTEHGKKSVAMRLKEKRKELQIRKRLLQERERAVMDRIHKAFRRSEHQLVNILEDRKGEVQTMYGDLMEVEGMYGGSKGRRWKVDWEKTPQPVQIKLKVMRGVKDKVPGGRYIMMVSLYNHLGGNLLRWSKLKAQRWGGTTLPLVHEGNFFNNELKVDHSVFTVLPSKPDIRPGMVIVFELFLLRGAAVSSDKVVGWGAFPITDGGFDVVEGKFKCPMLYGEMDPEITKHEKIEGLIASNIDHWLCNLYFEIVKLPRYLGNQKEHEVELQFSSMLLNYPDRLHPGEEYRDGEVPVYGSLSDVKSLPTESNMGSQLSTRTENLLESTPSLNGSQNSLHRRRLSAVSQSTSLPTDETTPPGYKQSSSGFDNIYNGKLRRTKSFRPPVTHAGSRYLIEKKKVKYGDDSDSTDCENEEDLYVKKKDRYAPVNGKPGMYYKRYKHNPVDEYHQQLFTLLPKTEALKQAKPKRPQGYLEELEEHSFSVHNPTAERGHEGDEGWEKMRYISRQFAAELGLSQWRSSGFWTILFLFCFLFFVRMYLHYVAQWGYLQMLEMPINKFDFLPYTVTLNYQPSLLSARQEVAVVMLGPIINIIFFTILVILSWLMQRLLGFYPDIGSKFNVVYGIHAFLDPILILIVDSALERYQYKGGDFPIADYAKLYYNFDREQGSGLAGIFITIFVYMFTMFLAGAILYMYFLRLHNNGRMLDIFWRLHGDADIFFVPYDLEMSNQELSWIIKKSEQWRGEEGERRKTAVYDYIWEEETVEETEWEETSSQKRNARSGKKEITTHVSIHTVHLDGLKELYRQFLRLPDGAIVEVFGDLTMPGMNKDIGKALNTGVKKMENLEEVDETKAEVGECSSGGDVSENQPQHTADGKAEHSIP